MVPKTILFTLEDIFIGFDFNINFNRLTIVFMVV
jgi:hypothetical protein